MCYINELPVERRMSTVYCFQEKAVVHFSASGAKRDLFQKSQEIKGKTKLGLEMLNN